MNFEEFDKKMSQLEIIYRKLVKKTIKNLISFIPQLIIFSFLSYIYFSIYQSKGFEFALIACLISIIFLLGRILGKRS